METIKAGPHYELASSELAMWLENQGAKSWWSVDGDPLLTGRLSFPCPAEELAAELRDIGRTLLVQAQPGDSEAKGQSIDSTKFGAVAARWSANIQSSGPLPDW